jgi:hypothetical protein
VQGLEPEVRFRHDVYRRCAYSGLAVRRRRALHTALADHLIASVGGGPYVVEAAYPLAA